MTFSPTISEKKSDEDDDSQPLVIGLSAGVPAGVLFILASLYFMKRRSDAKKKKAAGELPHSTDVSIINPGYDEDIADESLVELEAQDRAFALGEVMEA